MYSRKGNIVFMLVLASGALVGMTAIAVFKLSVLSLAILIAATFLSTIFASITENYFNKKEKEKRDKLGL